MAEEKKTPATTGEEIPKRIKMKWGDTEIEGVMDAEGNVLIPEEAQKILLAGIDQLNRLSDVETPHPLPGAPSDETGGPLKGANGMADNFKGLPMRELIANPLLAAAEAQEKLASVAWDFYQKIAYEEDGTTTRLLKFDLDRPVVEDGVVKEGGLKVKVEAPFIGLVPIPSLLIDRMEIDFQMEVTDTNSSTDKSEESLTTDISSKWFGVNVGISGKVSSSRESTRSSNQTAKYQVHVSASQQAPTEGLSKLMDIMASCIEPIPAIGGGGQ